jgi:hypothetical protein
MLLNNIAKLQTPTSKLGVTDSPDDENTLAISFKDRGLQPKNLFPDRVPDRVPDQVPDFVYKTPVETQLEDMQAQVQMKEVEFKSSDEYYQTLNIKLNNADIRLDKCARQLQIKDTFSQIGQLVPQTTLVWS